MPYTTSEFAALHKQLHEGGGRRQDRVRSMFTQVVTVTEVIQGRDGVYCRVKREGSTVESAPIRWNNPASPPIVNRNVLLKAWYWFAATGDNSYLLEYFGEVP